MSDTKALCEVVSAALDHHGNGEAQDAFEALMGRLRDAEKEREEDQGVIRVWRGRTQRAEADNAALFRRIDSISHSLGTYGNDVTTQELIGSILRQSHPGTALLEELEGLRRRVGAFDEAADYDKVRTMPASDEAHSFWASLLDKPHHALPSIQRLLDERQGAHNAALEEAEGSLFHLGFSEDAMGRGTLHRAMGRIRALKKTGQGA